MSKFLRFVGKHPKFIVILTIIITFIFAFYAVKIQINADYSAFLPYGEPPEVFIGGDSNANTPTSKIIQMNDETILLTDVYKLPNTVASTSTIIPQTEEDYPYSASYLVLIEADDLYQVELFNILEKCIYSFVNRREVGKPFSVLDFITLKANGKRLITTPISTHTLGQTWTEEELKEVETKIKDDPNLKYYLVSSDGNSMLFDFPIGGINNAMLDEFSAAFNPFREAGGRVYTNGGAVINAKVMKYLQKDLVTLVGLCLVVILFTFFLFFKSKRSVLIPASLSIIGLIWTFGTMTLLGYPITLFNIVTPCMVITLGSAYSVHILSEYYSDLAIDSTTTPISATMKIVKTIGISCLTTIFGFLCLSISKTSGLKDFGIAVSFGIFYCAFLAITYLPAALTLLPAPTPIKIKKQKAGIIHKIVAKLAYVVPKYWYVFIIIYILLFTGFILVKDKVSLDSNYMSYFPDSDPFGQESRHFANKMGGTNPFYITINAPNNEENYFLQPENLQKVWNYQETITKDSDDILQILSFPTYVSFANNKLEGKQKIPNTKGLLLMLSKMIILMQKQTGGDLSTILNQEANQLTLIVQHWDSVNQDLMTTSSIERVNNLLINNLKLLPDGTKVTISGDPIVNLKFTKTLFHDQDISTALSIVIVLITISIILLSLIKGFISITPVIAGIFINYIFMYLMKIPFDIVTVSFTSIAIGCGVDDAIHFIIRFSSNAKKDKALSLNSNIEATIKQTGYPIILTTLSIVIGMLMLSFASYTPIRYFGLLISVTLTGCMVSTLLFLPCFIIFASKIKQFLKVKN